MTGLKDSANRVLIIGGTGYIGKYMAKASVSQGYPTYVLVRPATAAAIDSFKAKLLQQFKDIGIHILEGSLDDHNSLVDAIKQVDIVISAVAIPQHLDQLNIINAIKDVGIGNIKRFVTIKGRFAGPLKRPAFHSPSFLQILMPSFMNSEEDIATLTVMMANDPRTMNRLVIYRPPSNIICQTLPRPEQNIPVSILHNIFVKGEQTKFQLGEEDLEACELYPEYKHITIDELLDISVGDPPETKPASFI
eukprot:PITA_24666